MADTFEVEVTAIDLSINMILFSLERAIGRQCVVEFEVSDCTKKEYLEGTFDVIYIQDTILHIQVHIFTHHCHTSRFNLLLIYSKNLLLD